MDIQNDSKLFHLSEESIFDLKPIVCRIYFITQTEYGKSKYFLLTILKGNRYKTRSTASTVSVYCGVVNLCLLIFYKATT